MTYTPLYQKENAQMDCDLADDELQRIVRMKEDLTRWLDEAFGRSDTDIEETFDEFYYKEWHRLTEISGSLQWTKEIPSCEIIRAQMAKEKMQARRPVLTNPATGAQS